MGELRAKWGALCTLEEAEYTANKAAMDAALLEAVKAAVVAKYDEAVEHAAAVARGDIVPEKRTGPYEELAGEAFSIPVKSGQVYVKAAAQRGVI